MRSTLTPPPPVSLRSAAPAILVTRHPAPVTAPPSVTPPPSTAPKGVAKISFGAIKAKKPETTRTEYPTLPDPDQVLAGIASEVLRLTALTEQLDSLKAELVQAATPFWFSHHAGRREVVSSVAVPALDGEQVLLTFVNRYKAADESALTPLLGEQVGDWFRQKFELKIDGDKIPVAAAEDLLGELAELFARHGAADALSVKDTLVPQPEFHERRHSELDLDLNLALQQACPLVVQVKTKGRK